jgi:hypothetical protein
MIFELNYRNEREWTDGTKPIVQITITMEIDENHSSDLPWIYGLQVNLIFY